MVVLAVTIFACWISLASWFLALPHVRCISLRCVDAAAVQPTGSHKSYILLCRADEPCVLLLRRSSLTTVVCLVFSREKALSAVVVDEMHLIGDSARGFLLELMLTKQRLLCPTSVQVRGPVAAIPSCCSCCTERPLSGRICVGFVVERLCAVRCCQRGVPHHAVSLRAQSGGPLLSCFVRDHGGFWAFGQVWLPAQRQAHLYHALLS